MAEDVKEEFSQGSERKESRLLFHSARKVLLAGIGAMSLAQEEVEEFVNRLVERGEIADKEGRTLVHEILEKRKQRTEKVEEELGKRVQAVLGRMNLPTKSEIDELSKKIDRLSKKIDDFKKT